MRETLTVQQESPIKIAGRPVNHLQFADDVDLIDGSKVDQDVKVNQLDFVSRRYGIEISLGQVKEFTYLGSVQSEDCNSLKEVKVRIMKANSALSRLKRIWRDKNISMPTKLRLLHALIQSVFLYGAESWTLNAEIEKRINSFEMNCYRRLLQVHWSTHTKNSEIRSRIQDIAGSVDSILATVKKKKLTWFGHVTRAKGTLANTILQGTGRALGLEGAHGASG